MLFPKKLPEYEKISSAQAKNSDIMVMVKKPKGQKARK